MLSLAQDRLVMVHTASSTDRYEGKVISVGANLYSMNEVAKTISDLTGKSVTYSQVAEHVYRGFLPPQQPMI